MNKYFENSEIGIKLIAWLVSNKQSYKEDVNTFANEYGLTLKELEDNIQKHGIERNLFEKLKVPVEKTDWIMVGTKIALFSNVAFQKYPVSGMEYLVEAEEQCFKALGKIGITLEKKEKFLDLAKSLRNDISLKEKTFIINKINDLIKEITDEKNKKMKTKILFFSSNPLNESRLKVDKEAREIEEGIRRANLRDNFEFKIKLATRPKDLSRAVLDESPNILHFSGHGSKNGIALEDDNGNSNLVTTDGISDLFGLFKETITCVILNSCYSESQAKSIVNHIQYVIGMTEAVPDQTAIEFAISFYDAIGAGKDIEFSFNYAVKNIKLKNIGGDQIPILLKRNS